MHGDGAGDRVGDRPRLGDDQGHVDLALLHFADQALNGADLHHKLNVRHVPGRGRDDPRQEVFREMSRKAQMHDLTRPLAEEVFGDLIVERHHPPRALQKTLAELGQPHGAAAPFEQRRVERILQPPHLLADGRLSHIEHIGCARESAGIMDGDEAAQQLCFQI